MTTSIYRISILPRTCRRMRREQQRRLAARALAMAQRWPEAMLQALEDAEHQAQADTRILRRTG